MMKMLRRLLITSLAAGMLLTGMSGPTLADTRTPVVVFPAFHFTILEVKVKNQSVFPECPALGKFEDWFLNPSCEVKLFKLVLMIDVSSSLKQTKMKTPRSKLRGFKRKIPLNLLEASFGESHPKRLNSLSSTEYPIRPIDVGY